MDKLFDELPETHFAPLVQGIKYIADNIKFVCDSIVKMKEADTFRDGAIASIQYEISSLKKEEELKNKNRELKKKLKEYEKILNQNGEFSEIQAFSRGRDFIKIASLKSKNVKLKEYYEKLLEEHCSLQKKFTKLKESKSVSKDEIILKYNQYIKDVDELKTKLELYKTEFGEIVDTLEKTELKISNNLRDHVLKTDPKIIKLFQDLQDRTALLVELGYSICRCGKFFDHTSFAESNDRYCSWINDCGEEMCEECFTGDSLEYIDYSSNEESSDLITEDEYDQVLPEDIDELRNVYMDEITNQSIYFGKKEEIKNDDKTQCIEDAKKDNLSLATIQALNVSKNAREVYKNGETEATIQAVANSDESYDAYINKFSESTVHALSYSKCAKIAYHNNESEAIIHAVAYSKTAAKAYTEKRPGEVIEAVSYSNLAKQAYIDGKSDREILSCESKKLPFSQEKPVLRRSKRLANKKGK